MLTDVVAVAAGTAGVIWILASATRTVVIPRPERVWLTTVAFDMARRLSRAIGSRLGPRRRHRLLGAFAPIVLLSLPLLWSIGLTASFAAIYWGLGPSTVPEAIELSGSSLTTLGFVAAPDFATRLIAIVEALMGLLIVTLMISFLPTLYGAFSRREVAVGRLTTRAGDPPSPVEFIVRLHTIGQLDQVGDRWQDWEDWFVELGETHTTFPALIYFRSARPERSWITAAETALDTAALITATRIGTNSGQADTLIRSGYLALRSIADFYRVEPELSPVDIDRLSVGQADFERLLDGLETAGLDIPAERDVAWQAFAGWRVNYDRAIVGLRERVWDVPTHWGEPTDHRLRQS